MAGKAGSFVNNLIMAIRQDRAALWRLLNPFSSFLWRFARTPERLLIVPSDLRVADPTHAAQMYAGTFVLAGQRLETGGQSPFQLPAPSPQFFGKLHGFGWLRHLSAAQTSLASSNARALVSDWIALNGNLQDAAAWEPAIVAERCSAWIKHATVVLTGAELPFYRAYLKSLAQQLSFLRARVSTINDPQTRLNVHIVLCMASMALPASAKSIESAARALSRQLEAQILPDGGHVGRNPMTISNLLVELLPLRQVYISCGHQPPAALLNAIDRMFPALRFFRHSDGQLALFNGCSATRTEQILALTHHDEIGGKPVLNAKYSGFQRLEMGDSVLISDTCTTNNATQEDVYAGALAFEFSSGRQRLIVNTGYDIFGPADFAQLARQTAAHSTLTVNDTSSLPMSTPETSKWWSRSSQLSSHLTTKVERFEKADLHAFKASHTGYLDRFGAIHERTLALSNNGTAVTGIDRIISDSSDNLHIDIRFHLHPDVVLHQDENGKWLLQAENGDLWGFESGDVVPSIETSIFFAGVAGPQKTRVVVLSFDTSQFTQARWRIVRIGKGDDEWPMKTKSA